MLHEYRNPFMSSRRCGYGCGCCVEKPGPVERIRTAGPSDAAAAIRAARIHIGGEMESSARAALATAITWYDCGAYGTAWKWAMDSLAYSVGIFHPEYRRGLL